jgi:hypothetical protein
MNRWAGCVVLVGCALCPKFAWGQPSNVAQTVTSESVEGHLRRGVELRRAGRDDEAVAEFVEAHRLAPGPRTAAQLGLARQATGAWLDADRLLRESLASPDDPWVTRNRAALESMLAVTATHLGTLDVRANVPGARVRLDGAAVATLPLQEPLRVLSGVVSLEVSAPGHVTVSRRFVIDPGATVRESVELRPEAPGGSVAVAPVVAPVAAPVVAPAVPVVHASRRAPEGDLPLRPWWGRWAWAPTSAGGAALALAGVALALREDTAVRYNSARCPPPPPPSPGACADLAGAAGTWETVAWTAGVTGAALVAVGVVMFALPTRGGRRGSALSCAPAGAGVLCALRF